MSHASFFNAGAGQGIGAAMSNALNTVIPKSHQPPHGPLGSAPVPYVAGSPMFKTTMKIRMTILALAVLNLALLLLGYLARRSGVLYATEQGLWVQFSSNVFLMIAMSAAINGRICTWKPWKRTVIMVLYGGLGTNAAAAPIISMRNEAANTSMDLYDRYGPALYIQYLLTGLECLCVVLILVENFLAIKNRDEEWRLFHPEEARVNAMMRGETVVEPAGSTPPFSNYPLQPVPGVFVHPPPPPGQQPYYQEDSDDSPPPEYKTGSNMGSRK